MGIRDWTEKELSVIKGAPGAFVIAVSLAGAAILWGVDRYYSDRIAFLQDQLEFKSSAGEPQNSGLSHPELKLISEEVKGGAGGIYSLERTVEVLSPFAPNALKIGVWAEFEEKLLVRSLSGGIMQSREIFGNPRGAASSKFGGIEIINPHGKYEIIIKTKTPNDVKIEAEFG